MDATKSPSERVTFFIGTYGFGITQDYVAKRCRASARLISAPSSSTIPSFSSPARPAVL